MFLVVSDAFKVFELKVAPAFLGYLDYLLAHLVVQVADNSAFSVLDFLDRTVHIGMSIVPRPYLFCESFVIAGFFLAFQRTYPVPGEFEECESIIEPGAFLANPPLF